MDSRDDNNKIPPEETDISGYPLAPLLSVSREILQEIRNIKGMTNLLKKECKNYPGWLTSRETMRILKISKRSLERCRSNNIIRFSEFNGRPRYKYQDVISVLHSKSIPKSINKGKA